MFRGYLERIKDHHVTIGGLSFNAPHLSETHFVLNAVSKFEQLAGVVTAPVLRDVGKNITAEMGQDGRIPVVIGHTTESDIHSELNERLSGRGVMDMWCKQEGSQNVVLPIELNCLVPILQPIIDFERQWNKDYDNWNMWVLVDTRKVLRGHTQRNSGFHYDGLNLAGKYAGSPNVSIYAWTNCLPTLFCKKPVKFDEGFQRNHNASILAQRMPKNAADIVTFPNGSIIKFDGATVHSCAVANADIDDRVFVRVCFTAPGVWFDRVGNTKNPALIYPAEWQWRVVPDPSVTLQNTVKFSNAEEFKNLWDVACLGHHAFAVMYSGGKSHEQQLVQEIRQHGLGFLRKVLALYAKCPDVVSQQRAQLLELKFHL